MNFNILIPLVIGFVSILQGALNRQISGQIGVAQASLITNLVTILICIVFYFIAKHTDILPPIFSVKASITTYKWWFLFPPIFGFIIVAGMPYAMYKLGAVKVTVGLIAAQMLTSTAWDFFVDGIAINFMRAGGILFAILSVIMVTLSK